MVSPTTVPIQVHLGMAGMQRCMASGGAMSHAIKERSQRGPAGPAGSLPGRHERTAETATLCHGTGMNWSRPSLLALLSR